MGLMNAVAFNAWHIAIARVTFTDGSLRWMSGNACAGSPPAAASFSSSQSRSGSVRIAVSMSKKAAISTTLVFNSFLAEEHAAATQALEQTGTEIEEIAEQTTPPEPQEDPSLVDQLGSMLGEGLRSLNARERIEQLRVRVADAVEHFINLIVIFVFQTVLLPLAFLWFVVELAKSIVSRTAKL